MTLFQVDGGNYTCKGSHGVFFGAADGPMCI